MTQGMLFGVAGTVGPFRRALASDTVVEVGKRGVASFSLDRRHRYMLGRHVGAPVVAPSKVMVVVGLNPSKADADDPDPTSERCIGFAAREGCDWLVILNLWSVVGTKRKNALLTTDVRHGPDADLPFQALRSELPGAELVTVVAWGEWGSRWPERVAHVVGLLPGPLWCLGTTKGGDPRHPLYLRADSPLKPWSARC